MTTEDLIRFDVFRLSEITDAEYEYLQKHPYSRKMRDECTFVNEDGYDFGLVPRFVRKVKVGKYVNAVYKDSLIWGFYERNDGVFVNSIRHSLEELYGEVQADTPYPINRKIASILEAIGMDVHSEPDTAVCVMFKFPEKYVLVED